MRAVHVLMAYSYRKQAYILIALWKKWPLMDLFSWKVRCVIIRTCIAGILLL